MNPPDQRGLTVAQVAEALQVNKKQVYELIHDGRIDYGRVGRHYRIPADQIDRVLRSGDRSAA